MKRISLLPLLMFLIVLPASAAYYWVLPKTNQCDVTLKTSTTKPKNVTFDTNITNFLNRVNTLFIEKCILSEKPPVVEPPPIIIEPPPVVVPPVATPSIEPPPHATWCYGTCTLPAGVTAKVWYGLAQTKWTTKGGFTGSFECKESTFGNFLIDLRNFGKSCYWVDEATLGALNPNGINMMPMVDMTALPPVHAGSGTLNLSPIPVIEGRDPNTNGGEFRIRCRVSHMAKDDPIVYPNVPGAAHLHAFFGNTGINAYSTNESLETTGNSTCSGGIANRSGYWVPALIDATTGKPANVYGTISYYKSDTDPPTTADHVQPMPKGLRMIAGTQKVMSIADSFGQFMCMDSYQGSILWESDHIKSCGDNTDRYQIRAKIEFPQCWDGKNLDSPDHQSHMAYACKFGECELADGTVGKTLNGCPASHPVLVPQLTVNANFDKLDPTHLYRLSSDNYSTKYPGGYSLHGDFMNGWDENIMKRIVEGCLRKHANAETDQLCDGQALVPFD